MEIFATNLVEFRRVYLTSIRFNYSLNCSTSLGCKLLCLSISVVVAKKIYVEKEKCCPLVLCLRMILYHEDIYISFSILLPSAREIANA